MAKDKVQCSVPRCTIVSKLTDGMCEEHRAWLASSQNKPAEPTPEALDESMNQEDFQKKSMKLLMKMSQDLEAIKTDVNKVSKDNEENTTKIDSNTERIKALEAKAGNKEECAIPLSITIRNVPKLNTNDDIDLVKNIIRATNADVDPATAVTKCVRKGYKPRTATQTEKLGSIFVELESSETRTKIMKAKKHLESLPDEGPTKGFKNFRISNMISQQELNQQYTNRTLLKMIPGGHQYYIAGNGALREVQHPQRFQQPQNRQFQQPQDRHLQQPLPFQQPPLFQQPQQPHHFQQPHHQGHQAAPQHPDAFPPNVGSPPPPQLQGAGPLPAPPHPLALTGAGAQLLPGPGVLLAPVLPRNG